jgi:hypothetical protein
MFWLLVLSVPSVDGSAPLLIAFAPVPWRLLLFWLRLDIQVTMP